MGLRSFVFDSPVTYQLFQSGVTRNNALKWLVSNVIRPVSTDRVIDIGCGVGTILDYLPAVSYVGVDNNYKYIEKAKRVYQERGSFYCADLNSREVAGVGQFDIALLIGVLHHLTDSEIIGLVTRIQKMLATNGRLITLDTTLVPGQHPLAHILARLDRGRYARSPNGYRQLLESGLQVNTEILRHDLLRVPYSHISFSCTVAPES